MLAAAIPGATTWGGEAVAGEPGVQVGNPAPDFVLRTLDDRNLRLSEFQGDVVVLSFWATWCGECRALLGELGNLHQEYGSAGLKVLAVNLDEPARRRDAVASAGDLSYPILMDTARSVAATFAVAAMPMTFVIDRSGVVRFTHESFVPDHGGLYRQQIGALLEE